MNKNELKCKCGATIFNVFTKHDCGFCRYNTDDVDIENDGECEMGHSNNSGCTLHICAVCGKVAEQIPFIEN